MSGLSRQELIERHRALASRHAVYDDLDTIELMELRAARAELDGLETRAERDQLQNRVRALEDQIAHAGCSAAHDGERTYECRIEAPCGLCRLRGRADAAEARVRELEAERDRHEARERRLTALGFEPPGQDAHTCGDALGLRRLDEVEAQLPVPEAAEDP